jgi:peptide deformylase
VSYDIRTFGDPVLKTCAAEITDIDSKLIKLTDEMFEVMYQAPGIGLAAPQIGVQKQLFVYDVDDEPQVLINPKIVESSGEWVYDEGCLSIPGLYVEMLRPKLVLVEATNLDGNTIQIEADELLARLFQHEIDHLQGVLMFERMTPDQRKQALAEYRRREENKIESEPTHLRLS